MTSDEFYFLSRISCEKLFFFLSGVLLFWKGLGDDISANRRADAGSPTLINVWQASGSRLQVASAKSTLTGETRRAASVSGAHVPCLRAQVSARVCVCGLKKVVLTTEAATCAPVMKRARRPFCLIKRRYVRGAKRKTRRRQMVETCSRSSLGCLFFPLVHNLGIDFIKSPAVLPEHSCPSLM